MSRRRKSGRRLPAGAGRSGATRGGGRSQRNGAGSSGGRLFVEGGWLSELRPKKKQNCAPSPASSSKLQAKGAESEEEDGESSSCYDYDPEASNVDSDMAEDYVSNIGPEFSVDELAKEMDTRYQQDIDFMDVVFDSDESDLDPTPRVFFPDDDSGYSSEDDQLDELVGLSREEVQLQNLDIGEEGIGAMIRRVEESLIISNRRKGAPLVSPWQKGVPGEKKRHRKELIAAKRKERALHRGVDLKGIKLIFENLISEQGDMIALQPMKNKDRALVHKLASAYRLKTGSQGTGKKRFVVVTRTVHTCLPDADDYERIQKMLGARARENHPTERSQRKGGEEGRMAKKYRKAARQALGTARKERQEARLRRLELEEASSSHKNKVSAMGRKKQQMKELPLSFVACGVMDPDQSSSSFMQVEATPPPPSPPQPPQQSYSSSGFGQFEAHTKGFGSRMLARMGFVEGTGLGKEGQGMTQPLQASMRPKSLGLGARTV